ncbi:MAG: hypothetical protein ABEJ44_06220 [Halanaeroarchaeum sp.]
MVAVPGWIDLEWFSRHSSQALLLGGLFLGVATVVPSMLLVIPGVAFIAEGLLLKAAVRLEAGPIIRLGTASLGGFIAGGYFLWVGLIDGIAALAVVGAIFIGGALTILDRVGTVPAPAIGVGGFGALAAVGVLEGTPLYTGLGVVGALFFAWFWRRDPYQSMTVEP